MLFVLIDAMSFLSRYPASGAVYFAYYLNYSPSIIVKMLPIAGVLATVFLFVNLQKNTELVVFFSLGISFYRLLAPVLACLFFSVFLGWYLTDKVVPKAMDKSNYYKFVEIKKKPHQYNRMKKRNLWFRTQKAIINFGRTITTSNVADVNIIFYDKENWVPTRVVKAESAVLNKTLWVLKNGRDTVINADGAAEVSDFKELTFPPLQDLKEYEKRQSRIDSMSISELSYAIKKNDEAGMATRSLTTEYYGKWSFIFSGIFLSLLALPFCIGNSRATNQFIGLGISMGLILIYWVAYSFSLNLGKVGMLPPFLAAWLPGILSLGFFASMSKKLRY